MRVCMHKRTHACLFVPACLPPARPSARLHAHAKAYYGTSSIHEYHTYSGLCLCRGCLARTSHHSFHAAVSPGQHRGGRRDKRLQSCLCPAARAEPRFCTAHVAAGRLHFGFIHNDSLRAMLPALRLSPDGSAPLCVRAPRRACHSSARTCGNLFSPGRRAAGAAAGATKITHLAVKEKKK